MSKAGIIFLTVFIIEAIVLVAFLLQDYNFQIFNPQGIIADQQKDLFFLMVFIMLIVAVPLLSALYFFAYRYRSGNRNNVIESKQWGKGEIIWWIIPSIAVFILMAITIDKTFALDPYKPLDSHKEPLRVQVVALQWKWLFLYPQYGIATVNYLQIPVDTPISFQLTSDGPMNSFWIPQLGGQIYAMTGMSTKLHLEANAEGSYRGQAVEINGSGYSGMTFVTKATSEDEFASWIDGVKSENNTLNAHTYHVLSAPGEKTPVTLYSTYEKNLYQNIILKYMSHGKNGEMKY